MDGKDIDLINQRFSDFEKLIDAKISAVTQQVTGIQQQVTTGFLTIDTSIQGLSGTLQTLMTTYVTKETHSGDIGRQEREIIRIEENNKKAFEELKAQEIKPMKDDIRGLQKIVWGACGAWFLITGLSVYINHIWK